ncbi:alginate lyase family protein [Maricaulis maris]|uniref:Alginate lyase n=1 Tax=Maricaulis maris TaxID=74318 RepID=A0A495D3N7_9PROT|nr:alginate lyase family protein [Maricaulis maris]RKQ96533.1 alginate lyase [Maricaulis maris]
MIRALGLAAALLGIPACASAQPNLILTEAGVDAFERAETLPPLIQHAHDAAVRRVETSIGAGLIVPEPTDPGGGYSHERHKENYKIIHDAGLLFAITGDRRYLEHAEAYLLAYADMYGDLPLHPERRNQAPGRLFWQSLNEAVWLVYSIQGYDAIRSALSDESRVRIEADLLRPMAEFLSTESPQTFQRIHNHGTWAAAAVGMTGYALDDPALVERALLGLDLDGRAGFLAQLDQLFSPDGYYTEGPYYQRYALMPFVLFGQAVHNNEPERGIFEHRDGILLEAILATIQQSYGGRFFPINDAIREKGLDTIEVVYGVAAAYALTGDTGLLSIAQRQGATVLTGDGLVVATDLDAGAATPFDFDTRLLRDGPDGDQGGLAILRMGEGELAQTVVAKHTGQGMGHGHFDKLSLILYDGGHEILTDYGAARFLNVPSKDGGRYLPENSSWARQTIAHNTVVLDEVSHHDGDWRRGQASWPTVSLFEQLDGVNVVSASIADAYPDTTLTRTTFQISVADRARPFVVDIFDVDAPTASQIDFPIYFAGQLTDFDARFERFTGQQTALGTANGYQHLWVEARADVASGQARFTWLTENRFYTYHARVSEAVEARIVRTGANDPDFNLRTQQGILLRVPGARQARFISVIEPHGLYDPASEVTVASESGIADIRTFESETATIIQIEFRTGQRVSVGLSHDLQDGVHTINADGHRYEWTGAYNIFRE